MTVPIKQIGEQIDANVHLGVFVLLVLIIVSGIISAVLFLAFVAPLFDENQVKDTFPPIIPPFDWNAPPIDTDQNHEFEGVCNNDGSCDSLETFEICPNDCVEPAPEPPVPFCGDGFCQRANGETSGNCMADCGCNRNRVCEAQRGENYANCEIDCPRSGGGGSGGGSGGGDSGGGSENNNLAPFCGDGSCNENENSSGCPQDCPRSAVCGDNACESALGENNANCPADCALPAFECGNETCEESLGENNSNCPADCVAVCGDAHCNGTETCSSCSSDCGSCPPPVASCTISLQTLYFTPLLPMYFEASVQPSNGTPTPGTITINCQNGTGLVLLQKQTSPYTHECTYEDYDDRIDFLDSVSRIRVNYTTGSQNVSCIPTLPITAQYCGDRQINGTGRETCDDGNPNNGDGCSNTCQIETGWGCTGTPSVCLRQIGCGNGLVEASNNEQCDGTNLNSKTCQTLGFASGNLSCNAGCRYNANLCVSTTFVRYNGIREGNINNCNCGLDGRCGTFDDRSTISCEACDCGQDKICGTLDDFDPLTITCANIGLGFTGGSLTCNNAFSYATSTCTSSCGDGTCQANENATSCPADCYCGNGIIETSRGEQCDDRNPTSSDGCSAACQVEQGWTCTGQPSICSSAVQWISLNNGLPLDSGSPIRYANAIAVNDAVYYFFGGGVETQSFSSPGDISIGTQMGRYNLQSKQWEMYTEQGWSTNSSVLPKLWSLRHTAQYVNAIKTSDGSISGIYRGLPGIIPTGIDAHGNLFPFRIENGVLKKWNLSAGPNGSQAYGDFDETGIIGNWNYTFGGLAVDETGSAMIVTDYGHFLARVPSRITALRWIGNTWKFWDGSGWTKWWTADYGTYKSIPSEKSMGGIPIIRYLAPNYYVLFKLGGDTEYNAAFFTNGLCISKYNIQTNAWSWWSNNEWTSDSSKNCTAVTPAGLTDFYDFSVFDSGNISIISATTNVDQFSFKESFFSAVQNNWTQTSLSQGSIDKAVLGQDSDKTLWTIFAENNSLVLMKKPLNGVWSSKQTIRAGLSSDAKPQSLVFLADRTPVLFFTTNKRLYAIAGKAIGDTASDKTIAIPRQNINPAKIVFKKAWNANSLGNLVAHLARDSEGNLYGPQTYAYIVTIHSQETDDPKDDKTWGASWQNYFTFPSGVAIDNVHGKVFVSDTLIEGGSGGNPDGRGTVRILDKAWNNQNLSVLPADYVQRTMTGFSFPSDVAVDTANAYLYVSESVGNQIKKFNSSNPSSAATIPLLATIGSKGSANGQFQYPQGIDVDKQGNLFVADAGNHRIQKFDSQGNFVLAFGSYGIGAGKLWDPYGLAVDPTYNLVYVTDPFNQQISIYNSVTGQHLVSWNDFEGSSFSTQIGGIVGYGNGDFTVSYSAGGSQRKLARFSIVNPTVDNNQNGVPDSLET